MRHPLLAIGFCLALLCISCADVRAATDGIQVRITAMDPAEGGVLPLNGELYLKVHYRSSRPLRIQARGLLGGEIVPGFNNASQVWPAGEHDALAFVGYTRPTQLDSVRVMVFNADWKPLVQQDFPANVAWNADAPPRRAAPWVKDLSRLQQAAFTQAAHEAGDHASYGSVRVLLLMGPLYLGLQIVLPLIWRGRWRKLALAPLLLMAPVYSFSLFALFHGANLWPLWIIFLSPVGVLWLLALGLLHWVSMRRGSMP